MIKSKNELEEYLSNVCMNIALDAEKCNEIYDYLKDKYDVPREITSDLICFRMTFSEASEFILFCLLDGINSLTTNKKKVEVFYTTQEIKKYSKAKYKVNKIKFPLRFKMIKIEEDQWVGKIDIKFLMQLRDAQMINYNINAQRTMQRVIKGDKEIYKINLNKEATTSIRKSMEAGTFIPNTLTLNIPQEDYDASFYYDDENMELVIKKLKCFHISDGFHRYIAACKASDENKEFDYNMELRIVNWNEPKVQTFIYQEEQKTPLKKVDSESLNMNKAANIIVSRVNNDIFCNMKGLINRNNGIINFGEMALLVDWFYTRGQKTTNTNSIQLRAAKEIVENINIITENNPNLLENKWDYELLLAAFCTFDYFNDNSNLDKRNMPAIVSQTYKELKELNDNKLNNKKPRKVLIDLVMNIIERIK